MTQDCEIDLKQVRQIADNVIMLYFMLIALPLLITVPALNLMLITLLSNKRPDATQTQSPSLSCTVCIVVPAHNEEHFIANTVTLLRKQLTCEDEVLVVADNCSDFTATLAKTAGANILERKDLQHRGKAYALEFARQSLNKRSIHPDVVIVVDADCVVEHDSIFKLCQAIGNSQGPVQALNLMDAPEDSNLRTRLLAFAFLVKNSVRPKGLAFFGAACTLTGTGMAFPWTLFSKTSFASDQLAEDLALSKCLAAQGIRAQLCPAAMIRSTFAEDATAQHQQKKRWEHGHMSSMFKGTASWIVQVLRKRQWSDLFLIMDTLTPPLTLYVFILTSTTALFILLNYLEPRTSVYPAIITGLGLLSIAFAIICSWYMHARQLIRWQEFLLIPVFMMWKFPVYIKYLTQKPIEWQRTRRPNETDNH